MSELRNGRGRFITIEGTDGAGKSTQLEFVAEQLKGHDIEVRITREPGGTEVGEILREVLLGRSDLTIHPLTQLLMVFAARAQHIEEVIEPALARGTWVVCDRFTDASYAYQGAAGELGFERVAELEQFVQGDMRPDLTILLDVPVDVGEQRTGVRGEHSDRFESLERKPKELIRNAYLELAARYPHRIRCIDASMSIARVNESISDALAEFLKTHEP